MAILSPDISSALKVSVTATRAEFAASMADNEFWMFVSSTNCWIKQANPTGTITCVAKALLADTDYMTINDGINAAKLYEFDTAGNGGTGGRVVMNVSAATTAASVAVILKAAIEANQTYLTVTHDGAGVLTLTSTSRNITLTENVGDAGFTVSYTPQATAAALSMYVPALFPVYLDGALGSNLSVLRDSADGSATLVRMIRW